MSAAIPLNVLIQAQQALEAAYIFVREKGDGALFTKVLAAHINFRSHVESVLADAPKVEVET